MTLDQNLMGGTVLFLRSVNGGATFTSETLTPSGLTPTIAKDSCGGINMAWNTPPPVNMNDIFLVRSINGGAPTAPLNLTNNGPNQSSYYQQLATNSLGNVFMVWEESTMGNPLPQAYFLLIIDASGNPFCN